MPTRIPDALAELPPARLRLAEGLVLDDYEGRRVRVYATVHAVMPRIGVTIAERQSRATKNCPTISQAAEEMHLRLAEAKIADIPSVQEITRRFEQALRRRIEPQSL